MSSSACSYVVVEFMSLVARPLIDEAAQDAVTAYTFPSKDAAGGHVMKRLDDWRSKGAKVTIGEVGTKKFYSGTEYCVNATNGDKLRMLVLFDRTQFVEALTESTQKGV